MKKIILLTLLAITNRFYCQLYVARDTINVVQNGYSLKMPWANGINYSNLSNIDLNFDGIKDVVAFDKINHFGVGAFRCFIKTGTPGQATYSCNPNLSYVFPKTANWAVFMDYNCDGNEDLFCSTNNGGIKVYKNVSTPTLGLNFVLEKTLLESNFQPNIGPLYAAPNGVPGISDIDGDGDIDILTFSAQGVFVEFHKNLSKELYSSCDSLVFELSTGCWGNIIESNCMVTMSQTCALKPLGYIEPPNTNGLHAGSCLTCFDSDGDGDKDLLMGDISCNIVQYVHNTGSISNAQITDTTKLYPNYPSKNNTTQIKMNSFPCTYYVDIDGDNKNDLIATPNATGSDNIQSVWYYKNTSSTNTVNFSFIKKNLMQDEMIEVGLNSYPVLIDYDSDGKKDLLIGTYGYFTGGFLKAQLTLFRNIGTLAQPSFSLITKDYCNLSVQNLNCVVPTCGDIDNDGDVDILIGTQTGQIHWLENTAGAGVPCNFSIFKNNPFNFTTPSAAATPQLFDIDKDGKLDLMIGGKNGRIMYYRNTGTLTNPSFSLMTSFFGNVDVKGNPNLYGIDGYAAPFFYNEGTDTKLLVGSISGDVFYFSVPSATSNCILMDQDANNIYEGGQAAPFFEDINNDNKRDLFVGNGSGGLSFFSSMGPEVGIPNKNSSELNIKIFPNPAEDYINIVLENIESTELQLSLRNIIGEVVVNTKTQNKSFSLLTQNIPKGIYILNVKITSDSNTSDVTKKIIIK